MAAILHGGSSHIFHHNHSHGSNLLNHQQVRLSGHDEMKVQIDEITTTQSKCKSENINVQAAFLHVLGDFIQSIGVIIAAVIIRFYVSWKMYYNFHAFVTRFSLQPEAKYVDPLITFLFSIIVICTTVKIFKQSAKILLEAVPCHISYENFLSDLKCINGVV